MSERLSEPARHGSVRADDQRVGGFELVPARPFIVANPTATMPLGPGDRILVAPGDPVAPGLGLAERQRDPRIDDGPPVDAGAAAGPGAVAGPSAAAGPGDARLTDAFDARSADALEARSGNAGEAVEALRPGDWWPGDGHEAGGPLRRRQPRTAAGELLYPAGSRWRIVSGDHVDLLEAPAAGTVRRVVPGRGIELSLAGRALRGALAAGTPTRGRLERVPGETGLRAALDVGRAGAILVVDGRVDSEAIIRARAMGVRGVVTAGLAAKDLRDLLGSEARQRASLQPLAAFAVLVFDGTVRRPIASPVAALLAALDGSDVALVVDPPLLVFDHPVPAQALSPVPTWIRIRAGQDAGREGRWLRNVGPRRFGAGVHLEAAAVALEDGQVAIVPLADLERFS